LNSNALARAQQSLAGLSVGDAFGQRFFRPDAEAFVAQRTLPSTPWYWTDDTEMALSIVDELREHLGIDPDSLVQKFLKRFRMNRGYGHGAVQWMHAVAQGEHWKSASTQLFEGMGSYGNGGAMRVAPLGAYFSGDPEKAREEAIKSAIVTHAHPEGQAGAIAVAVAACIVSAPNPPQGHDLLRAVAAFVPEGDTRSVILRGTQLSPDSIEGVARVLGSGYNVSSQDTVPFALFAAAHHLYDFEEALWWTVAGLGDRDTTCAMVGGIVSMTAKIPVKWLKAREELPAL
jgi:ADP-ribosylglycohydrolase